MSHQLRADDPVYYKCALRGLLQEARENGLTIDYRIDNENCILGFESQTGERAEVIVISDRNSPTVGRKGI